MSDVLIIAASVSLTTLVLLAHLVSTRCRMIEAHRRVLLEARRIERQRLELLAARGPVPRG